MEQDQHQGHIQLELIKRMIRDGLLGKMSRTDGRTAGEKLSEVTTSEERGGDTVGGGGAYI